MALQTFTAGQVLTAAQVTALQADRYNQTVSTKVASYVLVAADAGTRVVMNSSSATTITVNTSLFAAGDTLWIHNIGAGVCTITAGTATVSTAGSLALSQNQGGTLYFTSAGVAIFFPTVQASAQGLTLLNTTSFSAVSSVSFPTNTFTATYSNYLFMFDITASTALNVTGRLRAAGTDNSSTIYGSTTWQGSSSVTASGSASATSWSAIGQAYDANMQRNIVSLVLCNPQVSTRFTYGHSIFIGDISATPYPQQVYLGTNVTTSFDSITFGTNTGTISGSISCYGFNE